MNQKAVIISTFSAQLAYNLDGAWKKSITSGQTHQYTLEINRHSHPDHSIRTCLLQSQDAVVFIALYGVADYWDDMDTLAQLRLAMAEPELQRRPLYLLLATEDRPRSMAAIEAYNMRRHLHVWMLFAQLDLLPEVAHYTRHFYASMMMKGLDILLGRGGLVTLVPYHSLGMKYMAKDAANLLPLMDNILSGQNVVSPV